tara:strand:- start:628 stop:804 length:177 start_codon:yes stop_codon:yes gene_type:complete
MENNNLQKRIDKVIDKHDRILDENNFGLWIEPCPLYPKEHIKVERTEEDEIKELDFSS